jgi:hypothetical protein
MMEGVATPAADIVFNIDVYINGLSWQSYYADRNEDEGSYGEFDVLTSSGIDFFIMDDFNYNQWSSGYSSVGFEIKNNVGSGTWYMIYPHTDTWYWVYDNTDSWTQAHITGYHALDITPPDISHNLISGGTYSGIIEISASAFDESSIAGVALYIDDVIVDEDISGQIDYSWDTTDYHEGTHTIEIWTSDFAGNTDSVEIEVQVSNVNTLALAGFGFGGLALIVVLLLFLKQRGKDVMDQPTPTIHTGPYLTDQPPLKMESPPSAATFCPFCGSPRDPPGAMFCKNCGGKLGE